MGCSLQQKIDNYGWDMIDFVVCTDSEKNAVACNLDLLPVCGDNNKTYDNSCLACASHEIDWYFSWECAESCDSVEWVCSAESLFENMD